MDYYVRNMPSIIRWSNFLGASILLIISSIKGFVILALYFMVCYIWIYLVFVIQELREVFIKKVSFIKHFSSHWLILTGFTFPIISIVLLKYIQ